MTSFFTLWCGKYPILRTTHVGHFFAKCWFKLELGHFKSNFLEFQHRRNNDANYTFCCVFVINNPMLGTINIFFTSWELVSQQFWQILIIFSPLKIRPFVNYFVVTTSHTYGTIRCHWCPFRKSMDQWQNCHHVGISLANP
jgi:hypothetical protein